ncbi:Protein of unknown function (DUF3442)/Invasin, domain 3 [Rahnella aquatilis CIP 78.65 = ATCC 33071]|uniref:Invasin n=1 Tax=Rahnella aquatilis (strain ATCC 33071 / DSM 4594 / JCM 1683 / NBRC 105701 / NCIMB 13365 / CIP 78.65) TaxID=745277 RepID=H2IRN1_RAHAC|nr:Protein of unknown function (DUF3442)/Invasin, domain 3 [Rahnella aquatilis CIP 78.65 = ATCC 33071]
MFTVYFIMQCILSLAFFYPPQAVAEENASQNPVGKYENYTYDTEPYVLSYGETVSTVAIKLGIPLSKLREINEFRTFSHGFNHLKQGDEIDIPLQSSKSRFFSASEQNGNRSVNKAPDKFANTQSVANIASQTGTFFSHDPNSTTASSMALGLASSEASEQVQHWLSHFGTAKVKIGTDRDLSLDNSELDLLLPVFENKEFLLFNQSSIHRTDDRSQINFGLGLRSFDSSSMYGGNIFLDDDLSRGYVRTGLGIEYWRDFVKLGANSYIRITNWKDSPDVRDYQARPANGWDLHAQAWLPDVPQLGAKLKYEQYYGNEVDLFGKEHRKRNPNAISASINYTPIPLVTFSAEERQGKSGQNDSQLSMQLNYKIGVPWQQQITTDYVSTMRTLAGSRYDLVDRNNNIILEYRKKETIRLRVAKLITGYPGEKKPLEVSVDSKYGLDRIEWVAPEFYSNGGKITQLNSNNYVITLPYYQFDGKSVNAYIINGTAIDLKGNHSRKSETQVSVMAPVISQDKSTFLPNASNLPADGKSTQLLVLTLKDNNDNYIDVPTSFLKFIISSRNNLKTVVSEPIKKSPGIYEITITAGSSPDLLTITPELNDYKLPSSKVNIESSVPGGTLSGLTVSPASVPADGATPATLTLTVRDANGNAITGQAAQVAFAVRDSNGTAPATGRVTVSALTETGTTGVYTATLMGIQADTFTVTPQFGGNPIGSLQGTATLAAIPQLSGIDVQGNDLALSVASTLGFPGTGFKGASFAFDISNGDAKDFDWVSDATWVSVDTNGVVTFTGKGNKNKVTITATPKNGKGEKQLYEFTVKKWFTNIADLKNHDDGVNYCQQNSAEMPGFDDLTSSDGNNQPGHLGEWRDLSKYNGGGFVSDTYWTTYNSPNGYWGYNVSLNIMADDMTGNNLVNVMCMEPL